MRSSCTRLLPSTSGNAALRIGHRPVVIGDHVEAFGARRAAEVGAQHITGAIGIDGSRLALGAQVERHLHLAIGGFGQDGDAPRNGDVIDLEPALHLRNGHGLGDHRVDTIQRDVVDAEKAAFALLDDTIPVRSARPGNAVAIQHQDLHARSDPLVGVIRGLAALHPHQDLVAANFEFRHRTLTAHGLEQRGDSAVTQHGRRHVGSVAGGRRRGLDGLADLGEGRLGQQGKGDEYGTQDLGHDRCSIRGAAGRLHPSG